MKIVLDANILIAAFYRPPNRPCFSRDVFDYVVENATVYSSAYIFREFHDKCVKKLGLKEGFVRHLESLIRRHVRVEPVKAFRSYAHHRRRLRDPKDHPVLDLALSAGADLLLTWDKDLLALKNVGHVRILSPRDYWQSL